MREQIRSVHVSSVVRWSFVFFASLHVTACSKGLDGPTPAIEAPSKSKEPLPVDPGIVCRDQLTTKVAIHGEKFSPIPIDVPKAPKSRCRRSR